MRGCSGGGGRRWRRGIGSFVDVAAAVAGERAAARQQVPCSVREGAAATGGIPLDDAGGMRREQRSSHPLARVSIM